MSTKTYVIGRGTSCALRLDHPTVSRQHAELTVAVDGRLYLIDRRSTSGTERWTASGWIALRQDFVEPSDRLRFGEFECTAGMLVEHIRRTTATENLNHIDMGEYVEGKRSFER